MGKQTEQSPPEVTKLWSNQKSPRSPKSGTRSIHKLDRFESPRGSLTKFSDSPRLSLVFSNGSANDVNSPSGAKHATSASKQLDFSSPGSGSVSSSKNGTQVSPKGTAPRLLLETFNGDVGANGSQRFSQDSLGGKETAVADFLCDALSTDELAQIEKILHASSSRLEELYKKVAMVNIFSRSSFLILILQSY